MTLLLSLLYTTLLLLLLLPVVHSKDDNDELQETISNYKCNYDSDTCKREWQLDGECDSALDLYGCLNQDCWDCDPCQSYNWDCEGCLAAGCYWCATDAVCRSSAISTKYWFDKPVTSTCHTNWTQSTCRSSTEETPLFNDPLYEAMKWSYDMIHVPEVWNQGITGSGVHVRINDVGLDAHHTEFAGRFHWNHSCASFQSTTEGDAYHGTGVASLLAAGADNNECAVGIAPDVTISACTFQEDFIEDELVHMLDTQLDAVDISSNSWGPEVCTNLNFVRTQQQQQDGSCVFDQNHEYSPCEECKGQSPEELSVQCTDAINEYCTYYYQNDPIACAEFLDIYISCEYHSLPESAHQAFVRGVVHGRQGKGIIYVYAGGNSHDLGAVTNTDGFVNSRFTIAVGAVSKNATHASYSTTGSALHVTAPGGDFDYVANNIVAKPGGGCHDITGGTSFSAPVVSGVIALMLEVNPNLGWRDVQTILAHTSQQTDPSDESWTINGAGLHHSYKYGFGIVHAAAAVEAARNWTNAPPEQQWIAKSRNGNLTIADNKLLPTLDTVVLQDIPETFVTESVVLYLNLLHASRGDLQITLTSPSGTNSILHPSKRPENRQLGTNETWKLTTVRNWGENPVGEWKLTLVDESLGHQGECANQPFEHLYLNHATGRYEAYTCLDVEQRLHCFNGAVKQAQLVNEYVDRGRGNLTAAQACCFCGGGTPVSDVNLLQSWTLVVYGHDGIYEEEEEDATAEPDSNAAQDSIPPVAEDVNNTSQLEDVMGAITSSAINTTQLPNETSFLDDANNDNEAQQRMNDQVNPEVDDPSASDAIKDSSDIAGSSASDAATQSSAQRQGCQSVRWMTKVMLVAQAVAWTF